MRVFEKGDVVKVKGKNQRMVIQRVMQKTHALCMWSDGKKQMQEIYSLSDLEHAPVNRRVILRPKH